MALHEGAFLKDWIKRQKLTGNSLSLKLGVTRQNVYYTFDQKEISSEFKQRLAIAGFNIPEINVKPFTNSSKYLDTSGMDFMYVPFVNQYAYAGYMRGYADDTYIEALPKIPWMVDREYKGDYIAIEVKGDSMDDNSRDSYIEGDILLCREIAKDLWVSSKLHIKKWDFVIAHKEKGIIVKRIINHNVDKGVITIHSLNEQYPDENIKLIDVIKIFNVVRVDRKK